MKWFNDLKIFSKLLLSFALVAAIAGGIGLLGLWNMSSLSDSVENMYVNQLTPIRGLGVLNAEAQYNRVLLRDLLLTDDLTQRRLTAEQVAEHAKKANEAVELYKTAVTSEAEKPIFAKYESNLAEYRSLRARLIEAALNKQDAEAERLMDEAKPIATAMNDAIYSLVEINNKLADETYKESREAYNGARTVVIVLVCVAVGLAIALGISVGRIIARPVGELATAADKLATGDVNVTISSQSKDELGQLAESFRKMAESLRALIEDMGRMAREHDAGEIDVMIEPTKYKGAYREVAAGINGMAGGHLEVQKKSMACIAEFGRGNFEALLEKFPGKKVFINEIVEQVRANLKALIADAEVLAKAGVEGRLGTRADAAKHHGDFRKIVDGVNKTLDAVVIPIQEVSGVLESMAAGDVTVEINKQYAGDFNKLKDAVNSTANQFRSALDQIGSTTTALVAAAEELSRVSQQMSASAQETAAQANAVSAGSEQVSKNVQTVATGAEEMGASIKEIAKNTSDANRVATAAVRTAEQTNATIEKLGQSSAEIGEVIKVITSIAQQTNLLALNATIEAARAGEAGKGFAVVANEVKELAKETAKATEDISRKIEAIQGDTKGAVSAIHEIGGVIAKVNDISNTIASAVEEQSATTSEIGRNLGEAARGAQDIAHNVSGVAEAAASTSAGAAETQKSAQSLEQMAAQLQAAIGHFKYERRTGHQFANAAADSITVHSTVSGLVQ